jgi:peptidase M28-like protein
MDQSQPRASGHAGTTRRTFLSASAIGAAVVATPLVTASVAGADTGGAPFTGPGHQYAPQLADQTLRDLLQDIDQDRMQAIVEQLASFGTRHTLSSQTDPVRGIGAARDWIFARMQEFAAPSGGKMTVQLQSFVQPAGPRIPVPTVITNVIATLYGDVTPERVYVISGHYDSRCTDVLDGVSDAPGADDDASGVAVVMELARLFATRGSKSTIMFVAVAGEEQGLFGSAFMAAQLKAAGADIQGMFSNDIIGASSAWDGTKPDPRTVRLFVEGVPTSETPSQTATRQAVGGENDGPSRQLGRFVTNVAQNDDTGMQIRTIWRRDRYLRASDHVSFQQRGYPAARFTEPRENFNHEHQNVRVEDGVQFGDLVEFCDFGYICRVAKVNACALYSLAQGPGTPKNAVIVTTGLTNDSTLHWTRGSEPDLAGYEILWRESTAPDWTNVIAVGDVTSATIDLSKDNVQFGIRAVDADGHHSPVASPGPGA